MGTFSENLRSAFHQNQVHASATHSSGIWLLMLKDNIQEESPEFGMMSIVLNPEIGTFIGTFVYADQHEDISYQLEWSYREPGPDQSMDHYAAWGSAQHGYHDVIIGQEEQNPEVMGISVERPGQQPLIFIGIRMADEIPDCT